MSSSVTTRSYLRPYRLAHDRLLMLLLVFQLTTLYLYFLGPVSYGSNEPSIFVAIFVLSYLISFYIGSHISRRYYVSASVVWPTPSVFVAIASAIIIAFTLPTILFGNRAFWGGGDLGAVYSASLEAKARGDSFLDYLRMPFGIFFIGLQPCLLVFWKDLSWKVRGIGSLAIILTLLVGVTSGINKPLFDFAIVFSILWLSGLLPIKISWRGRLLGVAFVMAVIIGLASYFTETQLTRDGSPLRSGYDTRTEMRLEYSGEDDKALVFYSGLTSYLTQGYRAFDLALLEEYEWTFGVGHSTFLSRQVDRIFGTNISDATLPAKIEKYGWDRYINWSTFYLWWASDFHFVGVIFFMFMFGFVWNLGRNTVAVQRYNLYGLVFFSNLTLGVFYLSANNQLFQSGENWFATLLSTLIFFCFGRVRKIPVQMLTCSAK